MFLAGIQWLKTLDACLRRHDLVYTYSTAHSRE